MPGIMSEGSGQDYRPMRKSEAVMSPKRIDNIRIGVHLVTYSVQMLLK
jgi:hypothetical protein